MQMIRFEVFHHRRILKIMWNYFVSNAEVLKKADLSNIAPVDVFIRIARLRWFGHMVRMPKERIPSYLLHWVSKHGKTSRGRPCKDRLSCALEDAQCNLQLSLQKVVFV